MITSSPYKLDLEESVGKRVSKDSKKDTNRPVVKISLFGKSTENVKKMRTVGKPNQKREIVKKKKKEMKIALQRMKIQTKIGRVFIPNVMKGGLPASNRPTVRLLATHHICKFCN